MTPVHSRNFSPPICFALAAALAFAASCAGEGSTGSADWPTYGNDAGGLKYSPLSDIRKENLSRLVVEWEWSPGEKPIPEGPGQKPARPGMFQATPLAIRDTLYLPTPYNRVVALDANNGQQLWEYDPESWREYGQPNVGTGFVHRGVAMWTDGRERRIFINTRWRLIALDAATGRPIPEFGENGEVDISQNLSRPVERKEHYASSSPPVVWGDLVIVGNAVGDRLSYKGDPPGDVQAFDVHTGERRWVFETIPRPGSFGNDTWEDSSWAHIGHTNVWAPFTVDSARGLVYLPVGTPGNDWYGGQRIGNNLFAESIVCLDAATGERKWHFQVAHHGLWDYDPPAPPNLATIQHQGREVDVVVLPTKQGFLFVFDRLTGEPLWPIEERPVPASDVPGEVASATQPFPTRPAPYARQGFTLEDAIDLTPEIRDAALKELSRYQLGPMYTPPSLRGTVTMPGTIGGSGWGGAAVDPGTGIAYIKATNSPSLSKLVRIGQPNDTVDAPYAIDLGASLGIRLETRGNQPSGRSARLPIGKPPYGTLTAIDLNTGEHLWQVPFGDSPQIRSHPSLQGVALPDKLGVTGSAGLLVTASGLIFGSGGGRVLYAVDTRNGETLWEHDLGQSAVANPMTFRTRAGKQLLVIATGSGENAKLVAFALGDQIVSDTAH